MSNYRLYFINPETGHIERFRALEAADDQGAMAIASEHVGEYPLELWCAGRKAGRIEASNVGPVSRQNAA